MGALIQPFTLFDRWDILWVNIQSRALANGYGGLCKPFGRDANKVALVVNGITTEVL